MDSNFNDALPPGPPKDPVVFQHFVRPAPARPAAPDSAPRTRPSGALSWVMAAIIVILVAGFVVPRVAEEIQYRLTRGKQRANYELAGDVLRTSHLGEISRASQMVAMRVSPSVVIINVNSAPVVEEQVTHDNLLHRFGSPGHEMLGQGSGIVVAGDGFILTNLHVVENADEINVTLSDGRRLSAELQSFDKLTDLALLHVEAADLVPAEWGDSDELEVGSLIWAVGSPFGLDSSVSFGILSAKNRGRIAGSPHQDFLQTDAAINPGNSGGPLVNAHGQVVGVNTAIVGRTFAGVSFAIPSNVAHKVADRLMLEGYVPRGWLGVELRNVTLERAKRLGLDPPRGALVVEVVNDAQSSPAFQAGMLSDDVVVAWNGQPVEDAAALSQMVARTEIGAKVKVEVLREGNPTALEVTIMERPRKYNLR